MKYLVMECSLGYAVVLDNEGRFKRIPNLGYEVGQELDYVEEVSMTEKLSMIERSPSNRSRVKRWIAVAACFCIILLGGTLWRAPAGTVRIKINPDVRMTVNRFDRVVKLEGINEDGKKLIQGYNAYGKDAKMVSDTLADKSVEMGYLKAGGHISVTADSKRDKWKRAMEEKILVELEFHLNTDDDHDEDNKKVPNFVINVGDTDDDFEDWYEHDDKYDYDDDDEDSRGKDRKEDDEHEKDDEEDDGESGNHTDDDDDEDD